MRIRLRQALVSALELTADPFDFRAAMALFDAFARFGPVERAYARILDGLTADEVERLRALTRTRLDLPALMRLPERTLGHRYATFLSGYALSPDAQAEAFPQIARTLDENWLFARFCRVHDFQHALLGFSADPQGEMGLQAFHLRNFGEPFAALALASLPVTVLRYGGARRTLAEVARGWRLGARARNLFVFPFEEHLERDVNDVRAAVGLPPAGTS